MLTHHVIDLTAWWRMIWVVVPGYTLVICVYLLYLKSVGTIHDKALLTVIYGCTITLAAALVYGVLCY